MFNPKPYLLGARFSAVDIYVGSILGLGVKTQTLEKTPKIEAYLELVCSRPAYICAQDKDEKALKELAQTKA